MIIWLTKNDCTKTFYEVVCVLGGLKNLITENDEITNSVIVNNEIFSNFDKKLINEIDVNLQPNPCRGESVPHRSWARRP